MAEPIITLVILRAADSDPEGRSVEVRIGRTDSPTPSALAEMLGHAETIFKETFNAIPLRSGAVALPWVSDIDDADNDVVTISRPDDDADDREGLARALESSWPPHR